MKPEFATARTYSDQLRNFAAKYNALNEYVSIFQHLNLKKLPILNNNNYYLSIQL